MTRVTSQQSLCNQGGGPPGSEYVEAAVHSDEQRTPVRWLEAGTAAVEERRRLGVGHLQVEAAAVLRVCESAGGSKRG